MKISRRDLLARAAVGTTAAGVAAANAQGQTGHEGHTMPTQPAAAAQAPSRHATPPPGASTTRRSHVPVRTLNGWTLPWKSNGGWKEFHLVAEEFEHEFAPGCKAKVWGYNGSTPGPTTLAHLPGGLRYDHPIRRNTFSPKMASRSQLVTRPSRQG